MILAFELILPYGVWWGNSQHHLLDLGLFLSFLKPNADLYRIRLFSLNLLRSWHHQVGRVDWDLHCYLFRKSFKFSNPLGQWSCVLLLSWIYTLGLEDSLKHYRFKCIFQYNWKLLYSWHCISCSSDPDVSDLHPKMSVVSQMTVILFLKEICFKN